MNILRFPEPNRKNEDKEKQSLEVAKDANHEDIKDNSKVKSSCKFTKRDYVFHHSERVNDAILEALNDFQSSYFKVVEIKNLPYKNVRVDYEGHPQSYKDKVVPCVVLEYTGKNFFIGDNLNRESGQNQNQNLQNLQIVMLASDIVVQK